MKQRSAFKIIPCVLALLVCIAQYGSCETTHKVHFRGTDSELDVYTITGTQPGPTLLILGGIQGDEPGGYLAADLYADLSLKKGNLIVIPRANFVSIVENTRGALGDMNRKFAGPAKETDRDYQVVNLIKELMRKSDFFLNLHDGSGFYATKWESPERNPMRFGQSIISDAEEYTVSDGRVLKMAATINRVLEKINAQISIPEHHFQFNNHRTLSKDSPHKEQRLSATFHAVTKVGIPAFAIESSKSIVDYRIRVRYQTIAINAFLEEFGIVPEHPKIYLENPYLKYLIVSINGRTPIVVGGDDVLKVHRGDNIRIVHIESNYSRGLTARVGKGGSRFNDLNHEISITENTTVHVRKDRFVIGSIPVETIEGRSPSSVGVHFEPKIKYFCIKVNEKTVVVEPGDELQVMKGDLVTLLDPLSNMSPEDEKSLKIDLRGFQAETSPYPLEDRGHRINTAKDLQDKYSRLRGMARIYPLQAKLNNSLIGESYIAVVEPKLEYVVLREPKGGSFVAYAGDKLEIPNAGVVQIVDVKTNAAEQADLSITMLGKSVKWQAGSVGIDASKLPENEITLDIVRNGRSLGHILVKQGKEFRLSSQGNSQPWLFPVNY